MPRVVVRFDARSIVVTAGVLLGIAAAVKFVLLAQAGLTLIAIALFTAVALNPAVEFFARRGLARLWSVAAVYSMALALSAYQVIEAHTLRPLIYGRAVKISPLTVLLAIVVGTEIAGILGALAAIPIAGSIRVIVLELLAPGTTRDTATTLSGRRHPRLP